MLTKIESSDNGIMIGWMRVKDSMPIPRVPCPPEQELRRFLTSLDGPAVLTGLFAGRMIEKMRTLERALEVLGRWTVAIRPDYLLEFLSELDGAEGAARFYERRGIVRGRGLPRRLSLSRFLERAVVDQRIDEQSSPDELMRMLGPIDWMRDPANPRYPSQQFCAPFIASKGAATPMHYDGDYKRLLLYQVFGRKRAILVPPARLRRAAAYRDDEPAPDRERPARGAREGPGTARRG